MLNRRKFLHGVGAAGLSLPLAATAGLITQSGSRFFGTVPPPSGGSGPALGHAGVNLSAGSNPPATASTIIIDSRMNPSTYTNAIRLQTFGTIVRMPTATYRAGEGYYGQGCLRLVPGNLDQGGPAEHWCGIGQIVNLDAVAPGGANTAFTIGALVKFGSSWWTTGQLGKSIIVNRHNATRLESTAPQGDNTRPMLMPRGTVETTHGPCDGTIGNYSTDPNDTDGFNEGAKLGVDQRTHTGIWQWIQLEVNLLSPGSPVGPGQSRCKVWTETGDYAGSPTLAKHLRESQGGSCDVIDGMWGWCGSFASIDSNYYMDLEYLEIRVGQDTGLTPPTGFPGSAR
jgi:hypothetical protein